MGSSKSTSPLPLNEKVKNYHPESQEAHSLKKTLSSLRQKKTKIPMIVNGENIFGDNSFKINAPHERNLTLAEAGEATKENLQKAIKSSVLVQKDWNQLPWEERASVFLKAADLLCTKSRDLMNASTMLGQSKSCYQAEIDAACELADFFRFNVKFAENIYADQPLHSPRGQWNRSSARGLEGFVYAVAPFNFTSISVNLACAPALMGCSVIWKPSNQSALSSWVGMKILQEAGLPPGVINFVTGDPIMISKELLNNEHLAGVHFTGSTKVFESIWQTIGKNISSYKNYPRLVGETGGKDFIFAHTSAEPQALITALVRGSFEYQGQKCSASSRAYIPRSLWHEIKDKLLQTTDEIKMGSPEDFSNFMNAVIHEQAFSKIKSFIDHAHESSDAEVICGGECDDKNGFFIRPTIIETSNPHYKSMTEEAFGPILTVFVYEDNELDEAIELCRASTSYALTGAIFANDRSVINKLSGDFEYAAGNFYINDKPTGAVVGQQPFGGARKSGTNDKAGSIYNLTRWTSHRTIKDNFIPVYDYTYPHMT
tara:strand:+ start:74 stop:1702 length:1629 start_codon:yes stop_codon:yes gene_type:complete